VKLYREAADRNHKFDLVIMDLTIPGGMGGKEAVREIHKIDPQARVIVASGYSNDPIIASFAEYGFCAAVIKPFQLQDLAARIASALTPDKKTL
jgi:DNA-binding NarL/FixJ family response regulator